MLIRRREFLALGAASPLARALAIPQAGIAAIPIRDAGTFEVILKSPGSQPNGLQATRDGLWIMDQGEGSWAHLVGYDGKVIN